jgi:hypothetical protein
MQWWNDFLTWFYSDEGSRVVSTAIVPFLSIIIGAVIAALVARGIVGRLLTREDRDDRAAAVAGFIEVARQATQWANLPAANQDHLDALASASSIRLRLLPTHGAASAAEWAEHQIRKIKGNSASFSVQSEQDYVDFRDRLAEWQHKPKSARKLFAIDLAQFTLETTTVVDDDLVERQQHWAAEAAAAEAAAAEQAAADRAAAEQFLADKNTTETVTAQPFESESVTEPVSVTDPVEEPSGEPAPAVVQPESERPATGPVFTATYGETQPHSYTSPPHGDVIEATIDDEDPATVDGDAPPLVRPRLNDV